MLLFCQYGETEFPKMYKNFQGCPSLKDYVMAITFYSLILQKDLSHFRIVFCAKVF